jgi:hypothetical protein
VAEELRSGLEAFEEACYRYAETSVSLELDTETLEKLKSLGYVR